MKIEDFLHRKPVVEWLRRLAYNGLAPGYQLAEALGTPDGEKPGLADNVAMANDVIYELERRGWIRRGAHEPGRNFQFFGIGGRPMATGIFHVEYCWEPSEAGTGPLIKIVNSEQEPRDP